MVNHLRAGDRQGSLNKANNSVYVVNFFFLQVVRSNPQPNHDVQFTTCNANCTEIFFDIVCFHVGLGP